jgi:hypothetical protein
MISLWNCTYLFVKRKRNLKLKGYTSARTSKWTRASGCPRMLLRLMRSAPPLALFFGKHVPPAAAAPPHLLLLQLHAREGTQRAYPNTRESTACVPQCERERDHIAHVLMRERRERKHIACALMRETGREHSADAMCWVGACSTVRTTPGGVGAPVAVRVCTGVRARGEQHLLQHTETRWNN